MRLTGPTAPAAPAVAITFNGRALSAYEGETVAAALAAHDIVSLRKSRDDRERGLWCGMGACHECAVTIDGRIGERACLATVRSGMVIESALPASWDECAPLAMPPAAAQLEERTCDVLIVGAGPAGLSAALAAGRLELRVVVLDERTEPGGQFYKPLAPSQRFTDPRRIDPQFRAGAALEQEVRAIGVTIESGAMVWGAFGPNEIGAFIRGVALIYRPRRLLLATGAYERAVPIPGWTLPGVMTTGALQALARAYRVAPGKRVLIAGNGPLNLQLAVELLGSGVKVAGVVEAAHPPWRGSIGDLIELGRTGSELAREGMAMIARLHRARVPIYWRYAVREARGEGRFQSAVLHKLDASGTPIANHVRTIEADILTLGYGFTPSVELARALGCRLRFQDRHLGYLEVETGEEGRTTVPGVYAVGDGAEIGGAQVARLRGHIAGLTIAEVLGRSLARTGIEDALHELERAEDFQGALRRLFAAPRFDAATIDDATIICRCEGVTAGAVRAVLADGFAHIGAVKRYTRCGMGPCQGRYCAPIVARLVQVATSITPDPQALFAPRPPAKPVPLAALAIEKPEWGGHREVATPPPPALRVAAAARPPLSPTESHADVVVIGGGAVGTCCAYYLASMGVDVVLLERDELNMQASGANAGSLHVQLLSFDFGPKAQDGGFGAAETLPLAPESIRLWRELEQITGDDFEIRTPGGLMIAENTQQMRFLEAKIARERSFGIEAQLIDGAELRRLEPALAEDLAGAELCPAEGKINPLRATYSIARRARELGVCVVTGAEVTGIETGERGFKVLTSRGAVQARRVVNAAGPWSSRIARMVGLRHLPVQGAPLQMIVTEPAPPAIRHLIAHADRHLSFKQADAGGFIIGGGWGAAADPATGYAQVLRPSIEGNLWVARRVAPALDRVRMLRAWAAMNVNIDGAPILGEAPGHPGFFNCVTSNGLTLAPIVGRLTAEIVHSGRSSIPVEPYLLDRFDG